jgi:hypothetical protein
MMAQTKKTKRKRAKSSKEATLGTGSSLSQSPVKRSKPDKHLAQVEIGADATIFTTPENHDFYTRRQYKQLDPKVREIRLLKVYPQRLQIQEIATVFPQWIQQDNTDAAQLAKLSTSEKLRSKKTFICCELQEKIPLGSITGKFSALSYCAGSADETVKIMIDGYWFNAFANLAHSLDRFQNLYEKDSISGLLLWTDQACIDQANHQEKSHQVEFMRAIYEAAECTYVVLSTPCDQMKSARRGENALRALLSIWSCRPTHFDIAVSDPACTNLIEAFEEMDYALARNLLVLCYDILTARWWTRAWVSHSILSSFVVIYKIRKTKRVD